MGERSQGVQPIVKIGHYTLGPTLGVGTFGKVKSKLVLVIFIFFICYSDDNGPYFIFCHFIFSGWETSSAQAQAYLGLPSQGLVSLHQYQNILVMPWLVIQAKMISSNGFHIQPRISNFFWTVCPSSLAQVKTAQLTLISDPYNSLIKHRIY